MTLSLQVVYPVDGGTRFDMDYYLGTHMALVSEHMGPNIEQTLVTRGVSGGAPDTSPPFHAVATMTFASQAAMDAAMAAAAPVLADIPNFTDTTPQMLVGEVVP
jgi:uncharacterized protein (TIGR02118 family)